MSHLDFENAKAYLQRDNGGRNLYEHLSEVLQKILKDKPENASEMFEYISSAVKQSKYIPKAIPGEPENPEYTKFASATASLLSLGESGAAPVQDVMAECDALEWAGVNIGREDSYRLYLNMNKLAASSGATGLRFWGEILGRSGDYFIVEGIAAPHSEAKGFEAPDAEVGGPNRATYWVTSSPTGMWTQLPKVTPNQITAARKIKRYFSGSLSSKISGHPPFPGKEIHLLRAQIARIDASTGIAPAGHFTASDDDAFVVKAVADAEVPSNEAAALADVGAWVHRSSEITTSGRCKKEVKLDEEGNPVEDADAPEEIPPLREVSSDKEGAWVAKTCGGGGAHSLAVLKSQLWPGAVAVGYGKRFTNVYVGYGVKTESKSYTPQAPPAIGGEFEDPDLVEQKDVLQDPDAGKEEGNAEE